MTTQNGVVKIARADPLPHKPTPSVEIHICERLPHFGLLGSQAKWFLAEAEKLESALYRSLPGGLYDRLLGVMLRRKSSHFIVAYGSEDDDDQS